MARVDAIRLAAALLRQVMEQQRQSNDPVIRGPVRLVRCVQCGGYNPVRETLPEFDLEERVIGRRCLDCV